MPGWVGGFRRITSINTTTMITTTTMTGMMMIQ
jgi:hypothetical protein